MDILTPKITVSISTIILSHGASCVNILINIVC
jgi:hypothetical protein